MFYTIKSQSLTVKINSFGAEITSVINNGKEMTWQNPTGEWEDHNPVLFPFCGYVEVKIGEEKFPIKPHAFAKDCEFKVMYCTENQVKMSLSSNQFTKKYYPYDFIFNATFFVEEDILTVSYEVVNPTNKNIYYALGSHDSFNVYQNISDCVLEFEKTENLVQHLANEEGILTGEKINLLGVKSIKMPTDTTLLDLSLIYSNVKSESVTLKGKNGEKIVSLFFEGFDNLLLWSTPKGEMVCIEPWHNLPDKVNQTLEDFTVRSGVVCLQPKSIKTHTRHVRYY